MKDRLHRSHEAVSFSCNPAILFSCTLRTGSSLRPTFYLKQRSWLLNAVITLPGSSRSLSSRDSFCKFAADWKVGTHKRHNKSVRNYYRIAHMILHVVCPWLNRTFFTTREFLTIFHFTLFISTKSHFFIPPPKSLFNFFTKSLNQ